MEKLTSIDPKEFNKGFFIELECCMCLESKSYGASTKEELQKILDEEGWKDLDSDEYMLTGHHCGCDYRD